MGIREVIARARQAQQDHPQKHHVQLEIPLSDPEYWYQLMREFGTILPATYDEYMAEFRRTTLPFTEWAQPARVNALI